MANMIYIVNITVFNIGVVILSMSMERTHYGK